MIERIKMMFPWYRELLSARKEADKYRGLFRQCRSHIRVEAAITCDEGKILSVFGSAPTKTE